ncbi:hypothetical protein [Gillisia sp. Hel_I_86]|uniref:hypothetical protein n=1 Tax=Gillisia sp. Hel_I_86 TaxID=1249981 RepID=UPI0011A4EAE5|nr:hypothetical protein [Gillisia sp. Hel_I_86]
MKTTLSLIKSSKAITYMLATIKNTAWEKKRKIMLIIDIITQYDSFQFIAVSIQNLQFYDIHFAQLISSGLWLRYH